MSCISISICKQGCLLATQLTIVSTQCPSGFDLCPNFTSLEQSTLILRSLALSSTSTIFVFKRRVFSPQLVISTSEFDAAVMTMLVCRYCRSYWPFCNNIIWLTDKKHYSFAAQHVPRARQRGVWEQQVWQSFQNIKIPLIICARLDSCFRVFDQHQWQVRATSSQFPISAADNRKSATLPRTGGNPHLPWRPQRHLGQDWGGEHGRLQQGHLLDPPHRLPHALRQHLVLALLCDSSSRAFLLWACRTPGSREG